ncbi:hypothetical protein ACS0TY_035665 [Phlomoides rotata]
MHLLGDVGPTLVLHHIFLTLQSVDAAVQRSNIFSSTCTINGNVCSHPPDWHSPPIEHLHRSSASPVIETQCVFMYDGVIAFGDETGFDSRTNLFSGGENDGDETTLAYLDKFDRLKKPKPKSLAK